MGIEIERKFLVRGDRWRALATGTLYCQGYIPSVDGVTVRARIVGDTGYLTLKSKTEGSRRSEFEYPIPVEDAREILETLCQRPFIEKIRYKIPIDPVIWEIDEFHGDNEGLILAEVELDDENQSVNLPDWIDREVTGDPRYFNSNLVRFPYKLWKS
ncbi:CYTH domain-containing protein [Pannus brasiliensis CCIBt3594]|uniref:CYTH domain-containing protein n=1 Tax=Pannus brasiliensis CCIBt3594 TaxID=1427578 RepID=A0AAW9QK27_9CHRO